jgi:acetolactate synthase-1/2/3 large subunit
MNVPQTVAEAIAADLAARGVKRMFGVPGGGSSLDLIDAGAQAGIEFVLCRTETAAAIMAAVTGELTGVPGVVLTGIGPGAAAVVNGIAYASLERAPVLLITDAHEQDKTAPPHQIFDQRALFAPISKAQVRLTPENVADFGMLAMRAAAEPPGPVHIDLSAADAAAAAEPVRPPESARPETNADDSSIARAADLIAGARRPVLIVGHQARPADRAAAVQALAAALGGPAMTTYKGRGVIPHDAPEFAGTFTGSKSDGIVLSEADLILFCGADPVEIIPGRWGYEAPVVVIGETGGLAWPFEPAAEIVGSVAAAAAALAETAGGAGWTDAEIAGLRARLFAAGELSGNGHTAQSVIEALSASAPAETRLTVDAGAHMFSAMTRWPARTPFDVLKSNGLSTMGYAVPASIASRLEQPDRPVVAVTGDGGMMMSLSELSTAARLGLRMTVVVVNDAALSLIDIKQQRQQRPPLGVRYPETDFASAARSLGCAGWRVGRDDALAPAIEEALAFDGPAVVDVTADPSGYRDQMIGLRG